MAATRRRSRNEFQLIHRAIGFNARAVFGNALPAARLVLTLVATPGVNAIDRHARLVEWWLLITAPLDSVHFQHPPRNSAWRG